MECLEPGWVATEVVREPAVCGSRATAVEVGVELVERDDGLIDASGGPALYFHPHRSWSSIDRRAIRYVRGRVLDVGAGAGRVALHLQERGHAIVAIDVSVGALEVCRRRGVRDTRQLAIEQLDGSLGIFDTVVMFGGNIGLLASRSRGRRQLARLHRLTSKRGRIVGTQRDPYQTNDPVHLEYHRRNLTRGRMAGQLRIRVRYRAQATAWFEYLLLSPEELGELVADTGWGVHRLIAGEAGLYAAVLEKTA